MNRTKIEIFPAKDWNAKQVEQARKGHLARGAVSSVTEPNDDPEGWRVTTVRSYPDP